MPVIGAAWAAWGLRSAAPPTMTETPGWGQDGAGVARVDHAVVPEAGGGVVGVPLGLVLLAQRRLEGLLVLGAPGVAQLVAGSRANGPR